MALHELIASESDRAAVAADAVREAERVIKGRTGLRATPAKLGFDAITTMRPGFLQRQIEAMLPEWVAVIDPHWSAGLDAGDPVAQLEANADTVAAELLAVTDAHAGRAVDIKAQTVYNRLRPLAPGRVAAYMPAIAAFVARRSSGTDDGQ